MPHPHETQRLLADGRPAGPEQDALWNRIDATLELEAANPPATSTVGAWWRSARGLRRLLSALSASAVVAAGVFLWVRTPAPAEDADVIRARGPDAMDATLTATCGTQETPCSVGERVFLEVNAAARAVDVQVRVLGPEGATTLSTLTLAAHAREALTTAIVPELTDVDRGIDLELHTQGQVQRLHLEVRP